MATTKHFNNLDEVEVFLKDIAPDWRIERGKETYITVNNKHSEDYEVILVFSPENDARPFAEFWKGFYHFFPEDCNGFFGPAYARGQNYFAFIGSLEDAIQAIEEAINK